MSRDERQHLLGRGDSARIKGPILSQDFGPRTSAEPAPAAAAADPKGNDRSAYRTQDRMVWPVILGLTLLLLTCVIVSAFALVNTMRRVAWFHTLPSVKEDDAQRRGRHN
jgi:hypothetical protein